MKTFSRNSNNKMIGGVCSGTAKYFDVDPTIIRVVWAIAALFYGVGVLLYILTWIIAPEK